MRNQKLDLKSYCFFALPRKGHNFRVTSSVPLTIGSGFFLGLMPLLSYGQGGCGAANNVTASTTGGAHGEGFVNFDGGGNELNFYGSTSFSGWMTVSASLSVAIAGTESPAYRAVRRFTGGETIPGAYNFQRPIGNYFQLVETNWDQVDDADAFNQNETGYIAVKKGSNYGFARITIPASISSSVVVGSIDVSLTGLSNSSNDVEVGACSSLPVELVRFDADAKQEEVTLNWETATESNNAGFEIQRSTDGKSFTGVGWAIGYGNTNTPRTYSFIDRTLPVGKTFYYRLRQVDYDGQFEYSKIISVSIDSKDNLVGEPFPNPAKNGIFQVDLFAQADELWNIALFDMTGSQVHQEQRQITTGSRTLNFNFADLTAGTYFIKLENNQDSFYRKILIPKN